MLWLGRLTGLLAASCLAFVTWLVENEYPVTVVPRIEVQGEQCTARDLVFRAFTSDSPVRALALCADEGIGVCFVSQCSERITT